MENLEGKFRSSDSLRQREAIQDQKLSESKNKLLREAERKLLAHFHKNKIENAKILESRVSNLDIKEDADSGSVLYSGKVIVAASFLSGRQTKRAELSIDIIDNQISIDDKQVESALAGSKGPEEVTEFSSSGAITASLQDFKLVDDGSKYLKVYHTAAYGDLEPIGAVSKAEYVECADKCALLKSMLQDEAVAWPATIQFTSTFKDPIITAAVKSEEVPQYKTKAFEAPIEVAASEDISFKAKIADSFRLSTEAEQKTFDDLQNRITQRAVVSLMDALRPKIGNFRIKDTKTSYDTENRSGKVTVQAEMLDGRDMKVIPLEVTISNDVMSLPTFEQVTSLLKNTKVVESAIEATTEQKFDDVLVKTATPMAPTNTGYQEVLRLPKDFLPQSLKEGDVIEADGLRYKLVSKSEGQLSNVRDSASHWLFERVRDDSSPMYRVENY
jgi:hypothetical protein